MSCTQTLTVPNIEVTPSSSAPVSSSSTTTTTVRHRMRRVNSIAVASAHRDEKLQREQQPDRPLHECRDSLFSSSSKFQNYRGFLNLALIMLALCTGRVALENIIKYGILVDPYQIVRLFIGSTSMWPTVITLLAVNVFILLSFSIEKKLAKCQLIESEAQYKQIAVCSSLILFPVVMVFAIEMHPISASIACTLYSIVFLKLVSYHMVNYWCRQYRQSRHYSSNRYQLRRKSSDNVSYDEPNEMLDKLIRTNIVNQLSPKQSDNSQHQQQSNGSVKHNKSKPSDTNNNQHHQQQQQALVVYPANLTYRDLYYFMFVPTLCYELNFPRSERIRKHLLIKRLIEMVFLVQLNMALIQQWLVPTINNSLKPLQDMDYPRMLERLLKLAVPNHFIWLIWFYWYFHSTLNFMAELLRFGDKQFYRDWWNSESVEYFWKNWNIPVHSWAVRHLYKPLLHRGYSRLRAGIIVFMVSAFFHEYLVSVPLKMFGFWAFGGMLFQIPFAMVVQRVASGSVANTLVWISLIIGQPLCILACYHDYYVIHHAIY
ncbi:diacylglycerol O-acyltransferase 1-like [Oppia nitens]|uniref:diacylglycerol O-acyltransferase 1-like n=1 Tax=Oppia nitens TaxID=1686743 RepID=UPI0023DC9B37|nr:diacylglycerol O-acyltransferase 1-like [Oppia nitens]